MFADAVAAFTAYNLRFLPALLLFIAALLWVPRRLGGLRLALYIGLFIIMRDAMTPVGLWSFDALRIGFFANPLVLAGLGTVSVLVVGGVVALERDLRGLLVWRMGSLRGGALVGIGTGVLVAIPALALTGFSPLLIDFAPGFVLGLIVLAYGGNLFEELLFRGYLQGWLATRVSALRAALLSGLLFGVCHTALAVTVTNAGWPVLAFTVLEGVACGLVRMRYGLWAATLTHGTAILLLAMPMS